MIWQLAILSAAIAAQAGPKCGVLAEQTYVGPKGGSSWARAVAVNSKGEVYVGGAEATGGVAWDWRVHRYDAGLRRLTASVTYGGPAHGNHGIRCIAVNSRGEVVVAGRETNVSGKMDWKVIIWSPDLSRVIAQSGFDGLAKGNDIALDLALMPDDTIVVAGTEWGRQGGDNWRIVKYAADLSTVLASTGYDASLPGVDAGTDDPVAGGNPGSGSDHASGIITLSDGSIVVAGHEEHPTGRSVWRIIKYDSTLNRQLATTVYDAPAHYGGQADGIVRLPEDRIAVSGYARDPWLHDRWHLRVYDASLATLISATAFMDREDTDAYPFAIAADGEGNILIGGIAGARPQEGDEGGDMHIRKYSRDLSRLLATATLAAPEGKGHGVMSLTANAAGEMFAAGFRNQVGTIGQSPSESGAWLVRRYAPGLDCRRSTPGTKTAIPPK